MDVKEIVFLNRFLHLVAFLMGFMLLATACGYGNKANPNAIKDDPGGSVATKAPSVVGFMPTRATEQALDVTSAQLCPLIEDFSDFLVYQGSDVTNRTLIIYLLPPDGTSRPLPLIEGLVIRGQPWSPDSLKFIFNNYSSGQPDDHLSVFNLCTGEVEPLDLLGLPSHVYWSPDGRHLLYTAGGRNDTVGIVLYNFESQESRIISEIPAEGFWLYGWSPDSKKVAFVSKQTGQYDLYTLNVESLIVQQLTDSPAIEELVSWSPADNHLLVGTFPLEEEFTLNEGPTIDTFYILDDSGAQLRLSGNAYRAWTAAWSPDGEKIVYSNYGALCIIDVEEQSEICPLAEIFPVTEYSIAFDEPAAWSSGGDWLAFQMVERHKDPCYLMYMLELNTNTVIRAAQQMCLGSPLHWSSRP